MKTFYQCDVAESDTDSIWTGSIHYTETLEEAEFLTMLELQCDWGDGYMPNAFIKAFGADPEEAGTDPDQPKRVDDPVFPGADAWNEAGYWDALDVTTGMLPLPPLEALAQLKKITFDVPDDVVDAVMAGLATLHVVVDMGVGTDEPAHVPGLIDALAPKDGEDEGCRTCAQSIETRVSPCDECGHIDEEGSEGVEELLDKAEQKHNAQMLDGCETEDEFNAELRAQTQGR